MTSALKYLALLGAVHLVLLGCDTEEGEDARDTSVITDATGDAVEDATNDATNDDTNDATNDDTNDATSEDATAEDSTSEDSTADADADAADADADVETDTAPSPCDTLNLLSSVESGGAAHIEEQSATGDYENYRDTLGEACSDSWSAYGTLCDEAPNTHSAFASTKSDDDSGATWRTGETGEGILIIDAGAEVSFDTLQVYQMFSDGKVTHVRFSIHPETSESAPAWDDAGWISLGDEDQVGAGVYDGTTNTVIEPTSYLVGDQSTRYLKFEARNDGRFGDERYLEVRAIKMFQSPDTCPATQGCDGSTGEALCGCYPGTQDSDGDDVCERDCGSACTDENTTCDDSSGVAVCTCTEGFQDNDEDGSCLPDCTGLCLSNGSCEDASGVAVCNCDEGFQDNDGDGVCAEDCGGVACGENATCDRSGDVAECACDAGFQDNDGDGDCAPDCTDVVCTGEKPVCDDASGDALCVCAEGFQDNDGDGTCAPDCTDVVCTGENERCADFTGTAECVCRSGYQDNDGDGVCTMTCRRMCSGNYSCDDSDGTAECICDEGYQDNDDNNSCRPNCATQACDATTSTCDDTSGEALCACNEGNQDNDGDNVCAPDCSSVSCGANATCSDASGAAGCLCDSGFSHPDGSGDCSASCGTVNLLKGVESGGSAEIESQTATGDYENYRSSIGTTCSQSWYAFGTLCDEAPDTDSDVASSKSDDNSGATWRTGETGEGILVIDLGASVEFDILQVYQMFSDGKVTHVRFSIHPETGETPPTPDDSSWTTLGDYAEVGPGVDAGVESGIQTVTEPTSFYVAPQTTRYLKVEVRNDGTHGDGNYAELRAVKMFLSTCP